ncbi:MAG: acyltransferase [Chlorobi bacterium]|nr:acyltransferase [Chlorobiota bacterium]
MFFKKKIKFFLFGLLDNLKSRYEYYLTETCCARLQKVGKEVNIAPDAVISPYANFLLNHKSVMSIGAETQIRNYVSIKVRGELTIGRNVEIVYFSIIHCDKRIVIGDNCMIAESVSIRDHDHNYHLSDIPFVEQGFKRADVIIGNNVWIGAKSSVFKGVNIGDNVVIGANSVVVKDIPSDSVAVGAPARIIKKLE